MEEGIEKGNRSDVGGVKKEKLSIVARHTLNGGFI